MKFVFNLLVYVVPVLLVFFSSLGLLVAVVFRWPKTGPDLRRSIRRMLLISLAFAVLDFILLSALPRLGLSFGPIQVSLMVLAGLRAALLVFWLVLPLPGNTGRFILLGANLLLTGGLLYSFYFEPFDLQVTRIQLASPSLQSGRRVRIVQLSDTHVERTTVRERKIVEAVQSLQPDLIVLTGDYLNNSYSYDPQAVEDFRWLIGQLRAPLGIYAVSGSVETPRRARELFDGLGVTVLDDETSLVRTPAGDLTLVGITDRDHNADVEALTRVAALVPKDAYSILLYHNPDLIQTAARSGIDLYLAGHTHGGQICLPFYGAVITFSIYGKQFEQGMFNWNGTRLYVSRGLGMEGKQAPRARFLAPPEVVAVDVMGP